MVKSKGTAKDSAAKKTIIVELEEELPEIPKVNAQEEKEEIPVVPPENYIFVYIASISNIRPHLLSRNSCLKFRIQFGDNFVTDSPLISFPDDDDCETVVNWQASVPCFTSRTEDLDFLTSNPVSLSIAEEQQIIEDQEETQPLQTPRKSVESTPFAFCTLDLFPLILGEFEIRQTLLLDIVRKPKTTNITAKETKGASTKEKTPKKGKSLDKGNKSKPSKSLTSKGKGIVENQVDHTEVETAGETFTNEVSIASGRSVAQQPRISLRARSQLPILPSKEIGDRSNVVFLTVESIYNLPQDFDGDSMDIQAGTLIPNEFDNEQEVRFGSGFFTRERDKTKIKRWINIDNMSGKSSHTHYMVSDDLLSVSNKLGVDLSEVMSADAPRVEWNRVKRSWLSSAASEYLGEYLMKTKTWMVEVLITPKGVERKVSLKSKGDLQPEASGSMHLVAFFDVSALTFPGIQGVRVASQLFSYCKEDVVGKCGVRSKTVLSPPLQTNYGEEEAKGKAQSKGSKDKEKAKGKLATKGSKPSKKGSVSAKLSTHTKEEVLAVDAVCETKPWVNEAGEPVFVIFELELMKPLTERITDEELFAKADALIPGRPVVPENVIAATKAGEAFDALINEIVKKLFSTYQDFISKRQKMNLPMNAGDQHAKDFYQYLKESGVIAMIKKKLAESVGVLVRDKFGYDMSAHSEQDVKVKHKFVSELYTRLFEDVNTIINTLHSTSDERAKEYKLPQAQLKRHDIESRKLGLSTVQEEKYLQQRDDTDIGTLVVHSSQCHDLETAIALTLDLLSFDKNCREGLLLYAGFLALKGDFKQAEIFFQVTVAKYPEYMLAGYIFSLFHQQMGNTVAAEIVWNKTRRCTAKSNGRDDGKLKSAYPELLDWDANMYELKSVHLKCVELILYVRVMAMGFVHLALSNELEENGPSEPYYYYLAICHFRVRNFEAAIDILKAITAEKPRLNHIRRLLGHCLFEMGLPEKAVDHYEYVVETSDNGLSNHLVNLRLGEYYLDREDYPAAKAIFFESCRWTPTATSWLGVGIACFMEGDLAESERALTEANYLDRTVALVWGYLALINLKLYRKDKYEQCYCHAVRYNMKNDKVMGMIRELVYACGFVIPKLIHFDNEEHSF